MEHGSLTDDAAHAVTRDYLARLDEAASRAGLREHARRELRARVAEWIADARIREQGRPGGDDALTVVLDAIADLGPIDEVVAEAKAQRVGETSRSFLRLTTAERIALGGLATAWMTAGLGFLVAVLALLRCVRWHRAEKILALAACIVIPTVAVQLGTAASEVVALETVGAVALLLLTSIGIPVALRARVRRRHGLPV